MLETLRIRNYALIDELEVDFSSGFNVLTGETGAGKSIIIGALNLVLGARASSDTVRQGMKNAKVDAVFRIPKPSNRLAALLREQEIDLDDGELILSRTVTAEGRSRAYVSGNLVPASVLGEIGDELVDLHGQHEHQSLLKIDRQLDLLDAFASTEKLVDEVSSLVAQLRGLEKDIAQLESDDREQTRRIEFLKYEVNEINAANLQSDEEDELRARRNLVVNAEKIFSLASSAYKSLYDGEESAAIQDVDSALKDLEDLADIDDRFAKLSSQLLDTRACVEEISMEIRTYADNVEFEPTELDTLNERLNAIHDLKRKYGNSMGEVLAYRDRAVAEIEAYESRDRILAEMHQKREALLKTANQKAKKLSDKRKTVAKKLDKKVSATLQALGMKGGVFSTVIDQGELTLRGIDHVEFMLVANPGEDLKSLKQVASGGEISRIMLALKTVFANADKIPTLIFDEIDAGVGGHTAKQVASKLKELAGSHQTICISHLAQIAAIADVHYHVAKSSKNGRTRTTLSMVKGDARVEELARLLDGSLTEVSIKHAKSLLAH